MNTLIQCYGYGTVIKYLSCTITRKKICTFILNSACMHALLIKRRNALSRWCTGALVGARHSHGGTNTHAVALTLQIAK